MKHERSLAKIERTLPPNPHAVAKAQVMPLAKWFGEQPIEDCVMWVSCWAVFGELDIDQIRKECQPKESPLEAVCRLANWDYRRMLEMSNDWNRRKPVTGIEGRDG